MDFGFDIEIGGETAEKKQSIIEEIAYRDTWGKGISSYLSMMYERLKLMYSLLASDGSIYVHCDGRVNSYLRLILEDIFGPDNYRSWITWKSSPGHSDQNFYGKMQDTIHFVTKSENWIWNQLYQPYDESYLEQHYQKKDKKGRKFEDDNLTA